jgi:glutathione S-transferase
MDSRIITESAAITLHFAESHPAPPVGSIERAQVYRWLFYTETNIWDCVFKLLYTENFTFDPKQHKQIQHAARISMDQAWDLLENGLHEGVYLLGNTYSLSDPYLTMVTNWH